MLLTGQSSILTGAPGAVLLYPLLGLVVFPRATSKAAPANSGESGLLSRVHLRWILSGFWFFAALLQLQPYWWQPGQISQATGAMVGQGGLNEIVVDPILQRLSSLTANIEIPLNVALILVFLGLGIALLVFKERPLRPFLIASIAVSLVIWYGAEAFGMILTGMATDFNSGLLLVVLVLACWPRVRLTHVTRTRYTREVRQAEDWSEPILPDTEESQLPANGVTSLQDSPACDTKRQIKM